MTDLMRDAVISMPLEMAMGDEFSRFQFHDRAQELLKQVHSLEADLEKHRALMIEHLAVIAPLRAERDRLREALTKIANHFDDSWVVGCIERQMGDVARQALE